MLDRMNEVVLLDALEDVLPLDSPREPSLDPPRSNPLGRFQWFAVGHEVFRLCVKVEEILAEIARQPEAVDKPRRPVLQEFVGGESQKIERLANLAQAGIHSLAEDAVHSDTVAALGKQEFQRADRPLAEVERPDALGSSKVFVAHRLAALASRDRDPIVLTRSSAKE